MKGEIAPHITHMINSIINSGKIPKVLNISRILPLSKVGKSLTEIHSYGPVNNLPYLEKVLETHLFLLDPSLRHNCYKAISLLQSNFYGKYTLMSTSVKDFP